MIVLYILLPIPYFMKEKNYGYNCKLDEKEGAGGREREKKTNSHSMKASVSRLTQSLSEETEQVPSGKIKKLAI